MKRLHSLLDEIETMPVICPCGARRYPAEWKKKTQQWAKDQGIIKVCRECTKDTAQYVIISKEYA